MSPIEEAEVLSGAIFDGQHVDWQNELARAENAEQARIVRNLEQLARVAEAHYRVRLEISPGARLPDQRPIFQSTIGSDRRGSDAATWDANAAVPDTTGFAPGRMLGARYRLERSLGRGGMGEVWQAFDLKLCVDVALKRVHPIRRDPARREALRREVRAARAVVSPNVCRIFDLVEAEEQEMVSMEYVDGTHLATFLRQHAPLSPLAASEIASQLLSGLEAIHAAGLVHRDLKPENIMRTRTGRIVVMDFGIANSPLDTSDGIIAGTPAYMAPEQSRSERVDVRADIYAAAIVLAELLHGGSRAERENLWRGVRLDPPELPESPWRDLLLRAVAKHPEERFPTARAFSRAIEAVNLRTDGADDKSPYPGLLSFATIDAKFFFGREAEIETLIQKLQRLHMLAVVGPSGIGKTSFLRAGIIPSLPPNWGWTLCKPGTSPFHALGQALAPQFASDPEAISACFGFADPDTAISLFARWRREHGNAVLLVDQFEELFTQNPPEVQEHFAALLGRLPLEADVRVLLSMRDDFLFLCHRHRDLRPLLVELTLLAPLHGADLRRALIRPAMACGYRFEDDVLVDRMLATVESERAALPLLAFSAARLWEGRDRQRGLLTRRAYEDSGGVAGSLAQHAESVLHRVPPNRKPIVQEIFRNLITAKATRISRGYDELLSVFEDPRAAEEVLALLVDARLLTTFEVADPRAPSVQQRRVEIVHESLLSNWPRLVRWQTQDADGAQLRDQLRQAAQLWEERGRPDDVLWTGTVLHEFRLWRQRYRGGLTSVEESFASAMLQRAQRSYRRRRISAVAAFSMLLAGLGVLGVLWQRSLRAEGAARVAAQRAEGGKLFALGLNQTLPQNTFPYSVAALERFDQPEYRLLVDKLLLGAPMPFRLPVLPDSHNPWAVDFSPDGKWLIVTWSSGGRSQLFSLEGGEPRVLDGDKTIVTHARFSDDSRWLATVADGSVRVWSLPEARCVRTVTVEGAAAPFFLPGEERLVTCEAIPGNPQRWTSWSIAGGEDQVLGRTGPPLNADAWPNADLDASGSWVVCPAGRELLLYSLRALDQGPTRVLGRHPEPIAGAAIAPDGDLVASFDSNGDVRLWSIASKSEAPLRVLEGPDRPSARFDRTGSKLAVNGASRNRIPAGLRIWDLTSPGAGPLVLAEDNWTFASAFHPSGDWLVTTGTSRRVHAWPVGGTRPISIASGCNPTFTPDGRTLLTTEVGLIRLWPLNNGRVGAPRTLFEAAEYDFSGVAADDFGVYAFAAVCNSAAGNSTFVRISLQTSEIETWLGAACRFEFDPRGRWVAFGEDPTSGTTRLTLCETAIGEPTQIGTEDDVQNHLVGFDRDGRLLITAGTKFMAYDLEKPGRPAQTLEGPGHDVSKLSTYYLGSDRTTLLFETTDGGLGLGRIGETSMQRLPVASTNMTSWAIAAGGKVVAIGRSDGTVDVVRPATGDVRRMPVHDGGVMCVALNSDATWCASSSSETKLWPVPAASTAPPQSQSEFLASLWPLTNLRVVESTDSRTGYVVRADGLPDWQHPPRR